MKYSFLLAFFILTATIRSQAIMDQIPAKKFVHFMDQTGLVVIEALDPGMTLYSLSRKYNVTIDAILAVNPDLVPNAIPMGYPVNIPIYPGSVQYEMPEDASKEMALYYHVQPKETLYHISKTVLGMSAETITNLNPAAGQGLSIGQVLLIGWYKPTVQKSNASSPPSAIARDSLSLKPKDFIEIAHETGNKILEQKGLAYWKPGNVNAHFYVLHPTARVGSFMEITNPMLRRTITAKVAGHIPPGLYLSNVGIVVSPSIAKALGVLDQQFYASWRYVQ